MTTARQHSAATAMLGTPDRKPLYLSALRELSVDSAQDSLVIRQTGAAPRRMPLSRIDRIVCRGNTRWSGSAINQCAKAGIPIIWLDNSGTCAGATLPHRAPRNPLAALLERYVAAPGWTDRFDIWLLRRRLETLTDWAMREARAGRPVDGQLLGALKRDYVYRGELAELFPPQGKGWCQALVISRLQHDGIAPRHWGHGGHALELAEHIAGLLWAELNLDTGSLTAAAEQGVLVAQLFESWSHLRAFRIGHHLADLHRHLESERESWQ